MALAVVIALIAPKPEDDGGLVHIAAGSAALALAIVRIVWRLAGDVRPRMRDGFRFTWPKFEQLGMRALAAPASQLGRLIGFAFLALVPLTAALAIFGVQGGEDSPLLEAHEAAGTAVMSLAIAHALLALAFAALGRIDILGVTLWRRGPLSEGGARGAAGAILGAALAAAALAALWGPYDIAGRVQGIAESGEAIEADDD
jgi:cytochrome b561